MEQRTLWEANRNWATQEISHILWKLKVRYCLTTACHLALSWTRLIQYMSPSHSSKSVLILSFHLGLGFSSFPFPQFSLQKPSMYHFSPPYVLNALPIWCFLIFYPNKIWWGVQSIKLPRPSQAQISSFTSQTMKNPPQN